MVVSTDGDFRNQDHLVELSEMLISAHGLAQSIEDDELNNLIAQSLFRAAQLIARQIQGSAE